MQDKKPVSWTPALSDYDTGLHECPCLEKYPRDNGDLFYHTLDDKEDNSIWENTGSENYKLKSDSEMVDPDCEEVLEMCFTYIFYFHVSKKNSIFLKLSNLEASGWLSQKNMWLFISGSWIRAPYWA